MAPRSISPADTADRIFAALADATRRDLVRRVIAKGPMTTSELADGLPMSRQAVAKHLTVLVDAGLLRPERSGRETQYEAGKRGLGPAAKWVRDVETALERREEKVTRTAAKKATAARKAPAKAAPVKKAPARGATKSAAKATRRRP